MFRLKGYQQRAVDCLSSFLLRCNTAENIESAYAKTLEEQQLPPLMYRNYGFDQTPYVCLRIPTGGGKTVLGSYAIDAAARHYLNTQAPITLWLVPTKIIRQQTVEALKTPGHPYREKLDKAFNHQVLVLDIDEVTQIRPQDIGSKAIVIVSTLANLRVTDTSAHRYQQLVLEVPCVRSRANFVNREAWPVYRTYPHRRDPRNGPPVALLAGSSYWHVPQTPRQRIANYCAISHMHLIWLSQALAWTSKWLLARFLDLEIKRQLGLLRNIQHK